MIKPASSLLVKIVCWFFLNLALVTAGMILFFAYQPQVNLHSILGQKSISRLHTAAMLIVHDLEQTSRGEWSGVLARHSGVHRIDFVLMLEDGTQYASKEKLFLPDEVTRLVKEILPPRHPRPPPPGEPGRLPGHPMDRERSERLPIKGPPETFDRERSLEIRTLHPTLYWSGIRIQLPPKRPHPPLSAVILAVSDSITGNGFFFDPLPWIIVAAAVITTMTLLWIPMVRNITLPLARMTRATEAIANGRFDIAINETRADEIGRLARAINHMTARLFAFVKGQKRFLGDVAHELGSPIARMQFGLGALEQRVDEKNRERVNGIMDDVEHLAGLVSELLAFSRASMSRETVKLETIALLPVVEAAVNREITQAQAVILSINPEIRVVASSELLTRALANLLRNAVKYAGGSGPIHISTQNGNSSIAIEVRDSGPGVPEEYLDQLFEPFFRPEDSRDRDSGGVGLGLAIVKTCIETCKGTVSAHNCNPVGFAVTITLNA